MNPPIKRRHHTVPRLYLRRFANDAGQVMRVELPGTQRHPISVGNAAVVNDFYLIDGDGVAADAFENGLAALEGRAASAFTGGRDALRQVLEAIEHRPVTGAEIDFAVARSRPARTVQGERGGPWSTPSRKC